MSDEYVLISTHDLPRAGALRSGFEEAGYATDLVTPGERLKADDGAALLVLTGDVGKDGGPLARQARELLHVPVFAMTDRDSPASARLAGYEEIFGASASVSDVVLLGSRAIERKRLRTLTGIVGQTDAMRQVLERVVQIAPVTSTVLVTGESGTGKELVARGIHALSPRRHKPFIAVNVAALSDTLLESELFGHEKGAFTGAIDARRGLFELADGGTIFLDEVGEMPISTQTKLLRVLEEREFHRVGAEITIKVDVRIVAATNQDLRQLLAIGDFRRDLYFRLNVLGIELPALRERQADIPLLVDSFVRKVSDDNARDFPGISPEAMQLLIDYSWPGNIRELRNLVESMVVLSPGRVIRPEDLPEEVRGGRGPSLLPVHVPRAGSDDASTGTGVLRPELEFVFRTLVELRVDMDDLRRDFEAYRSDAALSYGKTLVGRVGSGDHPPLDGGVSARGVEISAYSPGSVQDATVHGTPGSEGDHDQGDHKGFEGSAEESEDGGDVDSGLGDGGVVVFRPGMTIDEMERRAIAAALEEVRGNRRKAAELLGIGERTLYRKISKYEIES
jgi:DNA-binding NtrC family response regulator